MQRSSAMILVATFLVWATVLAAPVQVPQDPPTWSEKIAPLIHSRCTMCHNSNGHGPFVLESYRDVTRRWELVRQEILNLAMPPCGFTSDYGSFCEAPELDDSQRLMFQKWIRAGMPKGDEEPSPPEFSSEFRLGTPDLVLRPSVAVDVPAEGNNVWQAVILTPTFTERTMIRAFDVIPKTPKSVRHVLLAVAADGLSSNSWETIGTLDESAKRLVGQWAPGYPAFNLPRGTGIAVEAGERLVALVQYSTLGRKIDSGIEVGLYKGENSDRVATWTTLERKEFELEPYVETRLTTKATIETDSDLLAVIPEARFFAYVIDLQLQVPEERTKSLLKTQRWSAYWNGSFVFRKPVPMPAGSVLTSHIVYENEPHSLINEGNRPRLVHSGKAFDQEVCRTHFLTAPSLGR